MILLPSSILVLLYTYSSTSLVSAQLSSSGAYTFSNDVTAFIPPCAQACFSSFVQENFPISICSSTPSLSCLCSSNSTSGYTVGEGALQCIISEDSLGSCQGANATATVVRNAFNMCSGEANALPNTHSTITATLEVQTSAPSIVLVVPTPTSSIFSDSTTPIASASLTANSAHSTASPTGSPTLSITGSPTAEGQTAASSAVTTKLTTPQIAGIAVGGGAVGILVIGGIIFLGCLRRRKYLQNDDDSYFGNFEEDHGNSMEGMFAGQMEKKQGTLAAGGTKYGVAAKLAPPIPPPPVITHPNMFSRRSVRTEEIGVAISPDMARETDEEFGGRHSSRLLPDKPALSQANAKVPQQQNPGPSYPYHNSPQARNQPDQEEDRRRDSVATQFEVDITSPVEFSKNPTNFDYGYAYSHEHGGPMLPNKWHQEHIPRSRTAPIVLEPRPPEVRKTQSHQSFSQPLKPRSTTSSVYTGRVSVAPSDNANTRNSWQQPATYTPFNPYKIKNSDTVGSASSVKPITQVESRPPEIRTADLSPVAESATNKSPVGVSPVSYPKIPGRLSDQFAQDKLPSFEPPWRQAELDAAQKRAQKRQEPKDSIAKPMYYINTNGSDGRIRRNENLTAEGMSHLAERRGKKLAPAFNFDKVPPKGGNWRVVNPDITSPLKSPMTGGSIMTPQKIGEDLFLDVSGY